MREKPSVGEMDKVKGKLYHQFYQQYIKDKEKPYDLNVEYWHQCSKFVEEKFRDFLYYGKKP